MSKTKSGILSLIIAAVLCITAGLLFAFMPAQAAKDVTPSGVFNTAGGAQRVDGAAAEGERAYLTYKFSSNGAAVNFQRNLALKWYGFAGDEGSGYTLDSKSEAKYFNLSFKFVDKNFEKFTLAMESTQMSQSKEGKTLNEIVFTAEGDALKASVNGAEAVSVSSQEISLTLKEDPSKIGWGDFIVEINGQAAGTFTNIGLNYAKYASSSADTPIMPLSFKADEVKGEDGTKIEIRSLNGQNFLLTENNAVEDNAAPVVVTNTEVKQFLMGDKNFLSSGNYTVIDVCSTAKTPVLSYYIQNPAVENKEVPSLEKGDSGYTLKGYEDASTDKVLFAEDFAADTGYVSVAFKLSDNNDNVGYAFYEWYIADAAEQSGRKYVRMVDPDNQPESYPETSFSTVNTDGAVTVVPNDAEIEKYQTAVETASKKDGKSIQVGTGAYFYLPSLRPYVSDDYSGYTDFDFTIYYRTTSSDTKTVSGDYNKLSIEVATEGKYQMRIVPKNRAGKAMKGYVEKNGTFKEVEISTSNVWDCENLPTFEFTVVYNGPSVDEVKDDNNVYRGLEYKFDGFKVIAQDTPVKTYTLYYLNVKSGQSPDLKTIRAAVEAGTVDTLGEWVKIEEVDEENEDAEYNDYEWNPDSALSFRPQKIGFYMLKMEVEDSKTSEPVSAFKLINVASDPDRVDVGGDPFEWLQNNVLSVVFLGVGVLCLIGIVVLLLVKPKDAAAVEAEKARKAEMKSKRENRK